MNNIQKIIFIVLGLMIAQFAHAQSSKPEKVSFKVFGNCEECKTRIETACDVKGIRNAEWDVEAKILKVVYVPEKITLEKIHEIVAACGHDTELKKAPDSVYLKLPDCCLYRDKPNTHH